MLLHDDHEHGVNPDKLVAHGLPSIVRLTMYATLSTPMHPQNEYNIEP